MKDTLEKQIAEAVKGLFDVEIDVELTRTEEQFGDYATNVALQLSKQLQKNPREIAEAYHRGVNAFVTKPSGTLERTELARMIKGFWLTFTEAP